MAEDIRFCVQGGQGEITEKKSRFIATLSPVSSEEEATQFIERIKKQYWDARHNCSAWVIGDNAELTRCSDDGEPPHTAGRPMLDVLLGEKVRNVCVVVTRYFGGTLLGTGGLIRAYQAAVKEGLAASEIAVKCLAFPLTITTDYTGIGKLLYLTASENIPVLETQYTDVVTSVILCSEAILAGFEKKFMELTAGTAKIEQGDPVFYMIRSGNIELL